MTNDERLNLRARQLLDYPTLTPNQRIKNPDALLRQLAENVRDRPDVMESMLAEITDEAIRERMRAAIEALL